MIGDGSSSAGLKCRTAALRILFFGLTPCVLCRIEGLDAEMNTVDLWESESIQIDITKSGLDGKISQLKEVLTPDQALIWNGLPDPLAEPEGKLVGEFAACMERVVSEGAALYNELRELGLREALDKIEEFLQDGDKLTISTDAAFFPWDILYPFDYNIAWGEEDKKVNPPRPAALWGYRFVIQYSLLPTSDEGGWSPPFAQHESGAAYISLNLNMSIEASFERRPFKPIEHHRQLYNDSIGETGGQWCDKGEEIRANLLSEKNEATIIYLYCHGSNDSPVMSSGNREEVLELIENMNIDPATLDKKDPPPYLRGPVIILNSCYSAGQSPLAFTSFHRKFRKKKAMGIVGTTIQMPATFAAAFGSKLILAYLQGVPLGKALLSLRRQLIQRGNPLALFYSLQCPPHVKAPAAQKG
jgi:hypothetical protein